MLGELADGRGLAGTVDTRDHDHGGPVLAVVQVVGAVADDQHLLQGRQKVGDRVGQQALHGRRVGGLVLLHAALEVGQQEFGGLDAGVGHQQRGLQFLIKLVVDPRAGEDSGQAGAGLAQAGLELVEPAFALGRGGGGCRLRFGSGGWRNRSRSCSGWRRGGRWRGEGCGHGGRRRRHRWRQCGRGWRWGGPVGNRCGVRAGRWALRVRRGLGRRFWIHRRGRGLAPRRRPPTRAGRGGRFGGRNGCGVWLGGGGRRRGGHCWCQRLRGCGGVGRGGGRGGGHLVDGRGDGRCFGGRLG